MKRIIAAMSAIIIIIAAFAGCNDPLAQKNNPAATEATGATEAAKEPKAEDYKNTVEGLRDYFVDCGFITIEEGAKNVTKMQADLIGAREGYRYVSGDVTVELYEFKAGNNATKLEIIDSVKKTGHYTLYSRDIDAYISDSEKFLMIYSDKSIGENDTSSDAYKKMQKAIKLFKAYKN